MQDVRNLVTPQEAADLLGVSRTRVHQLIEAGRLEVVARLGGKRTRLLDRRAVLQFKKARERKTKTKK